MKPWLFILLLAASTVSFAQFKVQKDSSLIKARSFNRKALNEIKNDSQFQYDNLVEPPRSIWERFWRWFWRKFRQIWGTSPGRTSISTMLILAAVSAIAFFVFKVMGMSKEGLFGKSSSGAVDYSVSHEDIHGISFEEAIQQAIWAGNYRLAIRLLYLQSLKILTDRGYIQWQVNKTNADYLKEVTGKKWASLFGMLTWHFDYAWYGELPVSKEKFESVQEQFKIFNDQL